MILGIIFLILRVAAYSMKEANAHGKFRGRSGYGFWDHYQDARKYKNRMYSDGPAFWGSTTFFVFLTDAQHLLQAIVFLFLSLSFGFLMGNHYYSLGAWVIIHTVHYTVYKLLSK